MNALETLFVNQYVEIEDQKGHMLLGQIEKIDQVSMRVGSIISKQRVPISDLVSQEVFVFFRDLKGNRFQFKARVIAQSEKSLPILELALPSPNEVLLVQRREYFRVQTKVKFEIEMPGQGERIELETHDISGGGLAFLCEKPPFEEKQSGLKGKLCISIKNEMTIIPFSARVVYVRQHNDKLFRVALKFTDIRESERNKVIKFCMSEQIKQRIK